jgi:hypothetical protein
LYDSHFNNTKGCLKQDNLLKFAVYKKDPVVGIHQGPLLNGFPFSINQAKIQPNEAFCME